MYLTRCQILLVDQRWYLASEHLHGFHKELQQLIKTIFQGHPSTVFCKISVRISKYRLKFSTAPERLNTSRKPLHSTRIFEGFVSTSLVFSEVVFLTFISPNSTIVCKKVPLRISLKRK